jgi:DNA-binding transcriptional regulator GbsR (MarR family)
VVTASADVYNDFQTFLKETKVMKAPKVDVPARLHEVEEEFVRLWRTMSSLWGISPTMAEIHGVLFITGRAMSMDDIMARLTISRGNVSMNLSKLLEWGLVRKVHKRGDRREYYESVGDVWEMFTLVAAQRKRREVDPILATLRKCREALAPEALGAGAEDDSVRERARRLGELTTFLTLLDSLAHKLLGSLAAFGLLETLFTNDLLGAEVKPVVGRWMNDLNDLCRSLKDQKLKDTDFQKKVEELYGKADLAELVRFMEVDGLTKTTKFPAQGAASLKVDLTKIEGLKDVAFGKQIFALRKGRSIVPHGHDNMATAFIVLRGDFTGRHYDRLETRSDHYLIKPTIDRTFKPGDCSTVSDHKDNVHWFVADSDMGFIFNIHILGYNPENTKVSSRVYLDPDGKKVAGGLIEAKKMTSGECHKKYG